MLPTQNFRRTFYNGLLWVVLIRRTGRTVCCDRLGNFSLVIELGHPLFRIVRVRVILGTDPSAYRLLAVTSGPPCRKVRHPTTCQPANEDQFGCYRLSLRPLCPHMCIVCTQVAWLVTLRSLGHPSLSPRLTAAVNSACGVKHFGPPVVNYPPRFEREEWLRMQRFATKVLSQTNPVSAVGTETSGGNQKRRIPARSRPVLVSTAR